MTNESLILLEGKIISTDINKKSNIIRFDQLNIDLNKFENNTIKIPKLQETSTYKLFGCILKNTLNGNICNENLRKEIVPILNRRIIYPFYLPLISMICCLLLVKNRKKILYNKYSIFIFCFFILLFSELILKFTGFSKSLTLLFALLPIILTPSLYFFLIYEFSKSQNYDDKKYFF